ncbi:DUF3299 domain-containing protein [Nitrogeniibacter aestuarii]|uniref:DUF3299 domain-containing protein n=1 Tax=Nitrogeniibacter aestuarii TaxID=2815343 RepID=UPI001D10D23E|nr:DUF3299 domain-containing protein [Nitrogeniibacter aestuarii]
MKHVLISTLICLATLGAHAEDYQVGDRLAKPAAEAAGSYKTITFDDLMPLDWDPNAIFKEIDLSALQDNDPRAAEMMDKIKQAWEQAPVVPALSGQKIRMAGFLVRLEGDDKEIREFLLVPYFGACIHVPPPPANQVVYVKPRKPVPVGPDMGAVWVNGIISLAAAKTDLGDAGYRIDAIEVEPYREEGQ